MKQFILAAIAAMAFAVAPRAFASCTNISGDPSFQYYCEVLQPDICTSQLTGGKCMMVSKCINIGGDPSFKYYCEVLQPDICTPQLTGGHCLMN
jgi:hypothetical protein